MPKEAPPPGAVPPSASQRLTAFHEAGHAVMAELCGRQVTAVEIVGDREHQSRGFGSEATRLAARLGFDEFNLNRIELSVFANNERAIRAYEGAGFTLEGRFREVYFRGGRYVDVLRYAILRSEWVAHNGSVDEAPADQVAPASGGQAA